MVKRNTILSFGMLWFFITLSIESSIVPISDVFFEHRTYLPSVGFLLLLTSGIFLLLDKKGIIYPTVILTTVSLLFAYLTYERNKVWKDDLSLTLDNLQKAPNKSRTNLNYGMALYGTGKKEEAIQYINKAVEINPDYYDAVNNRGNILSNMGRIQEALPDYLKCTKMQPDNVNGLCNLGITYAILKKTDEAIQAFNRVLTLSPQNSQGYFNRGLLYYNTGKLYEAEKDFEETLKLNPGNEEASKYLNQLRNRK
jgi:tetratricopeptide (TPR) repeat protein